MTVEQPGTTGGLAEGKRKKRKRKDRNAGKEKKEGKDKRGN
jgi:hypothetical protein